MEGGVREEGGAGVRVEGEDSPRAEREGGLSIEVEPLLQLEQARVSLLINLRVPEDRILEFKCWLAEIREEVISFPGFLKRDVVFSRPLEGAVPVSILLEWENERALRRWETSDERRRHITRAESLHLWDANEQQKLTMDGGSTAPWTGLSSTASPYKPSPPPKWKLGLIIWLLVCSSVTAWTASGATPALLRSGWVGVEVATLLSLLAVVVSITYSQSELLLGVKGISLWLKRPAAQIDLSSPRGVRGVLAVAAANLCTCLSAGCGCFNPKPPPAPPAGLLRRLARAEGRLEALRRTHDAMLQAREGAEALLDQTVAALPRRQQGEDRQAVHSSTESVLQQVIASESSQKRGAISIGVHHYVRWECEGAYTVWLEMMHRAMRGFDGFLSLRTLKPEDCESLDEQTEEVHAVIFRFASLETLQVWLCSKEREELLIKLQPLLLHSTNLYAAVQDRLLPDAFTDALYPSNAGAPLRPPAKWKVCCITIASLFLCVYPVGLHLPRVLDRMGITNQYGKIPFIVAINVFLNTYAMNPLLMSLVGHWLSQPRPAFYDVQPWKFFEQGFGAGPWSQPLRLVFSLLFYGPLILAWALQQ